jgi:chromosomal replication initiation ATPase DnaA
MQPTAISDHPPACPLRGRQVQVETARVSLAGVQDGRGGTVLVTGLAGLGKTTLLDAIEAEARDRGITVLHDQRFWLLREMQEALERAALRGPVLVSLDDVQWATLPRWPPSAR